MFFTIDSLVYSAYIAANSTGELKTVNDPLSVLQKCTRFTKRHTSHKQNLVAFNFSHCRN